MCIRKKRKLPTIKVNTSLLNYILIVELFKHLFGHPYVTGGHVAAKPCLVLELFLQLCQASFTASELTAFLKLFHEDHPPLVGYGGYQNSNL